MQTSLGMCYTTLLQTSISIKSKLFLFDFRYVYLWTNYGQPLTEEKGTTIDSIVFGVVLLTPKVLHVAFWMDKSHGWFVSGVDWILEIAL